MKNLAMVGAVATATLASPVPASDLENGGNSFVMRGLTSGTPVGLFLGVDPATGNSFDIMSIYILTVKNALIPHVYHLEDWTGAIAQLTVP